MLFGTWAGADDPCPLLLANWGPGRFPSLSSGEAQLKPKEGTFCLVIYENQLHNSVALGATNFLE
jgi:hypothetical protein